MLPQSSKELHLEMTHDGAARVRVVIKSICIAIARPSATFVRKRHLHINLSKRNASSQGDLQTRQARAEALGQALYSRLCASKSCSSQPLVAIKLGALLSAATPVYRASNRQAHASPVTSEQVYRRSFDVESIGVGSAESPSLSSTNGTYASRDSRR